MEVPGIGTVYRYQGRANFAHQIAEADRLMTEHCLKINGGRPVIVSHEKVDLGTVSYGSAQANTTGSAVVTGSSNSAVATGSSATTVTATSSSTVSTDSSPRRHST